MRLLSRLSLLLFLLSFAGCQSEQRDSLHQMEHVTPAHWPNDLQDAALKIKDRFDHLQSVGPEPTADDKSKVVQKELAEIVGWMPEVAADSFIDESQWEPVNEASLELSASLEKLSLPIAPATATEITQFVQLLSKTAQLEAANKPPVPNGTKSGEILVPESQTDATNEGES
jgi:hypothetical protein